MYVMYVFIKFLEGTNEIMRVIIARRILAESASEVL